MTLKHGRFETRNGYVATIVRTCSMPIGWVFSGYVKDGNVCIISHWDAGGRCITGLSGADLVREVA